MQPKHLLLISLIFLSEIKAVFYKVDKAVSWYLFSDHKRQVCVVIEDYANIVIFGVVFWFLAFEKRDKKTVQISLFLFILNALDLLHLGLYDMQGFVIIKLFVAYGIYYKIWSKLKHSF